MRQGTTKHSYFIIQFEKDENISIKLNLEPEELKEKYNDALMPEYKGESFDIFTKIFKIVTNISIILPGNFKR